MYSTTTFIFITSLLTCEAFAPRGMMSMMVDDASFHTSQNTLTRIEIQSQREVTTTLNSSPGFSIPNFGDIFTALSSNDDVPTLGTDKRIFFESLDTDKTLNEASKERTNLLNKMIASKVTTENLNVIPENVSVEDKPTLSLKDPGLAATFNKVASGTWKVVYAPHMTTISGLFGGKFDVQYTLNPDGTMVSHARYEFPIIKTGYLSVSGTYGSVDENISRVDFDRAWVKPLVGDNIEHDMPYNSLDEVPESFVKNAINNIGKAMFIDAFAVFPVSFLDDDTIVFDFELLGTRICAKKI